MAGLLNYILTQEDAFRKYAFPYSHPAYLHSKLGSIDVS